MRLKTGVVLLIALVLLLAGRAAAAEIEATIGMLRPERHFFQICLRLTGFEQHSLQVAMPVWTPGSYKIRDFARNVETLRATDGRGAELPVVKLDKSSWSIERGDAREVFVRYDLFAHELSVRTSFLDDRHGYINPASVLMYVVGSLEVPYRVKIEPPEGWQIDTALEGGEQNLFRARDYDELVDSPIEIGTHRRHDFEVRGVAHRAVFFGEGNLREQEMVTEMRKIVIAAADLFGELPYPRYLFLTHLGAGGGGLEHKNSTSMMTGGWRFDEESGWKRFLGLVAHEYFHLWNVKRIHDTALGPFDYSKENYSRLLWIHEGWTSYYGQRLLLEAGLISTKDWTKHLEGLINGYRRRPGRKIQSLEESSFDSWIKSYQRNDTSANSTVSYYSHGEIAALCFDLLLRHHSRNQTGLDDVMRALNERFARQGRGITAADVRSILVELGGQAADDFWDRHVSGIEEVPFEAVLALAGLRLSEKKQQDPKEKPEQQSASSDGDDRKKAWERKLDVDPGFSTRSEGQRLFVSRVNRESEAWSAGLAMADEILAIGDRRVTARNWSKRLAMFRPGARLSLLLAREGRLIRRELLLSEKLKEVKLVKDKTADELSRSIYAGLFAEPFEQPETGDQQDAQENDL